MPRFESMDGFEHSIQKPSTRKIWIIAIILAIVAFVIGILLGRYAICSTSSESSSVTEAPQKDGVFLPGVPDSLIQDAELSIRDTLLKSIDNKNIEKYLSRLTEKPHIAGSVEDEDLAEYIRQFWLDVGFDEVQMAPYDILLSYPDMDNPNFIEVLDGSEQIIYRTPIEEDVLTPGKNNTEGIPPFNAYSPKGIVEGNLVYVNYGRVEDYIELQKAGINVTGCVAISRYGRIFRGSKVDIAQKHGAIGLILFSDPSDYAVDGQNVYPDDWWLPGSGAQRGTIFTGGGDPLTPGYPATEYAYRYGESEVKPPLPKIPAHPIGYTVARELLINMTGDEVPDKWRGGINITYRYGPGFIDNNWKIRMNISTTNVRKNSTNVIGFIKGKIEPDRYILFGNHRDAWVYGAIDPSSGTAVMMETSRALAALVKSGKWRPRRSIVFCSWAAEEYGLIGSTEWVEEYIKNLKERAVAYLNIDISVEGTDTLRSKTTPLLYRAVYEATKMVENPNPEEVTAGRKSVYDTWLYNRPWTINNQSHNLPQMESMGSGSDYAPILQRAGVTSVDFRYTYDKKAYNISGYPLYHSQYETFYAVKNIIDPDFEYHGAVAKVGVELARSLADSLIIPFNVSDYAWSLENLRVAFDKENGDKMRAKIENYDDLEKVIQHFDRAADEFGERMKNVDKNNPILTRLINDQLVLLEKAFLDPAGLPMRPLKKHMVIAESAYDSYASSSFPGLVDLLFEIEKATDPDKRWEQIKQHFAVILHTILSAASTLRDVTAFHT
ncbi:hypothetical protein LOTGIDRAFT_185795 [Lottia gigantea]|uniref:glutamate carboxypeptidase II n=1 Tax=Lottia gigantea TaxID=225164 RepID=V4B659_LOTGI|nr:hypothetical protein LOTGIDRAFT_185795 [Lottia gigantea]ESP03021.1 hypothetical protein LOTGIDRAFT_185795 [Lottia gigantea]